MYCIMVEGTGLNDFVEDALWDDYDYQTTSVTVNEVTGLATYWNCLEAGIDIDKMLHTLQQLDRKEVERIFKLNR